MKIFYIIAILISISIIFLVCGTYHAEGEELLFFSDADKEELILEYGAEQQIFDRITTSYSWNETYQGIMMTEDEYRVGVSAHVN